jgi:hypothetical protein
MPSFKTADGREWLIRLDAPKIREVRTELEIDLGALDFSKIAQALANDPVLLVDVLWVLCREQAQTVYHIESRAFGESLVGDALDDAAEAIIKARADFSPARMKALILKTAETSERIRAKAAEMATARLSDPALEDRILKATEAKLMAEMEAALTRLECVANSPESAASTHAA